MILTQENYYSPEASKEYMSVSQYHDFMGTPAFGGCEHHALAIIEGTSRKEMSTPMLIGQYCDSYFEKSLDKFKKDYPQIFKNDGGLRAEYLKADEIIKTAEADELFMKYQVGEGEAQVIVTGIIGGILWKGKLDRLHRGLAIVDGKIVASIRDRIWCDGLGKVSFIEAYSYIDQAAVYRELHRQMTGELLPFFITALSKEKVPDKEVIEIGEAAMDNALQIIESNMERISKIKSGHLPAIKCGKCDWCKSQKKLYAPISYIDLC